MSSGVSLDDCCITEFENLKMKHIHGYIIFKLSNDFKTIVVDCIGEKGASYDEFKEKLLEAGAQGCGRYAVFDFHGSQNDSIVFLTWLPDNQLPMKQKMLYTSSKKAIREKFQGVKVDVQCNDEDDLCYSNIQECVKRYSKV